MISGYGFLVTKRRQNSPGANTYFSSYAPLNLIDRNGETKEEGGREKEEQREENWWEGGERRCEEEGREVNGGRPSRAEE